MTRLRGNIKILVVDDKWENRSLLVSLLLPLGFEVMEATDGRDGLNKALEFQPDLIFMDLIMPVLDGFEATRQIRKLPTLTHTKIIAVSASTLISAEQILEFGCDDYLPKPVSMQELLGKLAIHLELEWVYEPLGQEDHAEPVIPVSKDDSVFVPPPSEIKALYELVLDGNFKMLRDQLDKIERMDKQYARFVEKIRELANTLDDDTICKFLDQYIGG